jgi:chemotaxis-related protein WspB
MLMLLFYADNKRYACPTDQVVAVIPKIELTPIPVNSENIVGAVLYQGELFPVLDWCQFIEKRACKSVLDTRIILFNFTLKNKEKRKFGLLAENVTEVIDTERNSIVDAKLDLTMEPYVERSMKDEKGIIQLISLEALISNYCPAGEVTF